MLFASFFKWWFVEGWHRQLKLVELRFAKLSDIFSFDLLARTLFSPFRQISSGAVRGSLSVQLGAWRDRTLSRVIGAVIRMLTMFAGAIVVVGYLIFSTVRLVGWLILPFLPLVGIILSLGNVMPWND